MENLSESQIKLCEAPLPHDVVKKLPGGNGADYVTGHYVITRCNQVFGYDGWSFTPGTMNIMPGPRPVVHVQGVLAVKGITRGDVGVAVAATDKPDALETAIKAAFTDALKRCARTFGASFGLALYDKARADIGMSKAAEDMLVDLDDVTDALTWWRGHSEAIERLVADEKAIITAAFVTRRRELDRIAAERQAAALPANSDTTPPRGSAPAVVAPVVVAPVEPAALVTYRARVGAVTSIDALVAVCLALAPTVMQDRDAAWKIAVSRAVDLGSTREEFTSTLSAARTISAEPAVWTTMEAVTIGLDAAKSIDAVNAVVKAHGAAVVKLPEALRAALNTRSKARRTQLVATPSAAAVLEKRLRDAGTIPALEALVDEIDAAGVAHQINAAEIEFLSKLQDELVSALEREVAA